MSRDRYPESAWVFYFMKKCNKCKEEKLLEEFNKDKSRKEGYAYVCKKCHADNNRNYEKKYPEKVKEKKRQYRVKNKNIIKEKRNEYNIKNKNIIKEKRKEYDIKNKETRKEYQKQYRTDNKDIIKEKVKFYNKKYWIENKENKKKNRKKHQLDNPELYKEYNKNFHIKNPSYLKEYEQKTNILYPHLRKWRNLLSQTLKRLNKEKLTSTQTLLGYSSQELKEYLDNMGMDWNYHHIDHKIPVTWFKSDTPVHIVNDLRNLQPLPPQENRTKLNTFMTPVPSDYLEMVGKWIKEEYKKDLAF